MIDLSLTGTSQVGGYVLIDGAQFQGSNQENMYLDQTNETLLCAANVGVPLTLAPAELGMGTSSGTGAAPLGNGLKLRVECSTAHPGAAKLVAPAGASGAETVLAAGIGSGVSWAP